MKRKNYKYHSSVKLKYDSPDKKYDLKSLCRWFVPIAIGASWYHRESLREI